MEYQIKSLFSDITLGICKIGNGRNEEIKSSPLLLSKMLGYIETIEHNKDGKPIIASHNISITHTKGLLAIILSKKYKVGIDIEYISNRVKKVAKRFLCIDEKYTNTTELLQVWCAKEAIYKLYSEQHLSFQNIHINLKKIKAKIYFNNSKKKQFIKLPIQYLITEEYVLCIVWKI